VSELFLGVELTDRCDLACSHCLRHVVPPNSTRARDLDPEVFARAVAEAKALGFQRIGLTGGEPMLHPRFLDMIDIIVDAEMPYHFLSNGLGLPALMPRFMSRPQRRELLVHVCISLDGATEQTHDNIRGRGTFRRTLAGIAFLRAMNVPFVILSTIGRANRHEIEQLALKAHHLGAKVVVFSHFLPSGRPHATNDHDLTSEERHDVEAVIARLKDALRFPVGMGVGYHVPEPDYMCPSLSLQSFNVDASGHLTFCCELSSFNGEHRPARDRADFVADMAHTSLSEAMKLKSEAAARFRAHRLDEEARGLRSEADKFPCRYCIRHFGKPEGLIPLRRRSASV
jgi:MoaA/NifB/PqqE/SkfB family radical SAM enzyme